MFKAVFVSAAILWGGAFAFADMYDTAVKKNFQNNYSVYSKDESEVGYRVGGGFAPSYSSYAPVIYRLNLGAGLGCGDYNLSASFNSYLNKEMITDYVKSASLNMVQALPWLILAETQPAWYDKIKDGMAHARQLQMFAYKRCQDYMADADQVAAMKNSGKQEEIKQGDADSNLGDTVDKKATCAKLSSPNGLPLGDGQLQVVRDTLDWNKWKKEDVETAVALLGDIIVQGTSCDMTDVSPTKNIFAFYADAQAQCVKDFQSAVDDYQTTGEVSPDKLEKISTLDNPVTLRLVRRVALTVAAKQPSLINELASLRILAKTKGFLRQVRLALARGEDNAVYPDPVIKVLKRKKDLAAQLSQELEAMRTNDEEPFRKKIHEVMGETDNTGADQQTSDIVQSDETKQAGDDFDWGGQKGLSF